MRPRRRQDRASVACIHSVSICVLVYTLDIVYTICSVCTIYTLHILYNVSNIQTCSIHEQHFNYLAYDAESPCRGSGAGQWR